MSDAVGTGVEPPQFGHATCVPDFRRDTLSFFRQSEQRNWTGMMKTLLVSSSPTLLALDGLS
jgi:hypothetical protein